jgi:hypothetical protein
MCSLDGRNRGITEPPPWGRNASGVLSERVVRKRQIVEIKLRADC